METKVALKKRCKDILHNTKINTLILSNDFDFLCSVFAKHPKAKTKLESGICKICVIEKQGSKCFYFQRNDGVKDNISYRYAIDGYGTIKGQIIRAARITIAPIIMQYRNSLQWGKIKCCITNETLYPENTHIDHFNMTFAELIAIWLKDKDLQDIYDTLIECSLGCCLPNLLANDFIDFHNGNTHLRPITICANLQLSKHSKS